MSMPFIARRQMACLALKANKKNKTKKNFRCEQVTETGRKTASGDSYMSRERHMTRGVTGRNRVMQEGWERGRHEKTDRREERKDGKGKARRGGICFIDAFAWFQLQQRRHRSNTYHVCFFPQHTHERNKAHMSHTCLPLQVWTRKQRMCSP